MIAFIVRLPGVFWGVQIYDTPHFISYHPDEPRIAAIAEDFFNGSSHRVDNYPKGFPFQISLIAQIISPFTYIDTAALILIGRVLSLLYGVLTVLAVFFISKELFVCSGTPIMSALFLSLSGLHITNSHFGSVDAGNTFWFYATLLSCLLYLRKKAGIYLLLALLSAGFALAFKLAWYALLPLLYVLFKVKKKAAYWFFSLFVVFLVFFIANGGRYTLDNFNLTLGNVLHDNISVIKKHDKYLNPLVYFVELFAGIGGPFFLLLLYGSIRILKKEVDFKKMIGENVFPLITMPLLLYFISISFLDIPFPRQILPLVPAAVLLASYGFTEIRKTNLFSGRKIKPYSFLIVLFLYQAIYIGSNEYYFVFDTRETAKTWIKKNIPYAREITISPYVIIPELYDRYQLVDSFNSPYVILHESYYYRYIGSILNPYKEYPAWNEIYHGTYEHYLNIQKLFKGNPQYRLVKKFEVKCITPEMIFYKRLWGSYYIINGNVLIYKKVGDP